MKKLLKISSYTLATVLAFLLSNSSAFAAGENGTASLSSAQVVGGLSILLLAIMIPTIRKARREEI